MPSDSGQDAGLRVAYAVVEVYPYLKTGGLADVSAALPPALRKQGIDARLVVPDLPAFSGVVSHRERVQILGPAFGASEVAVARARLPDSDVPIYLIEAAELFDRPGNPYVDENGIEYADNHRRFALFGWAVARFADGDWRPDIVHAHDWHAGLVPAWLASIPGPRPASIFTIHNLAYQGLVPAAQVPELGLPSRFHDVDGIEYHGGASFMKAGIYFADALTTVSPTYAQEIQSTTGGMGLEGLLSSRSSDLIGILNGVDPELWNPATDRLLEVNYDANRLHLKAQNKVVLQSQFGLRADLNAPLCIAISRLIEQKGIDVLLDVVPDIVDAGAQLLVLGSGDQRLEARLTRCTEDYPGQVAAYIGYDDGLSHQMFGGGDLIIVPSRFEPCGLTQLYGLRYATLPIVTPVGGLADTVVDADQTTTPPESGNGFVTRGPAGTDLRSTLTRAFDRYHDATRYHQLQQNAMSADFSWTRAAEQYAELYRRLRRESI